MYSWKKYSYFIFIFTQSVVTDRKISVHLEPVRLICACDSTVIESETEGKM